MKTCAEELQEERIVVVDLRYKIKDIEQLLASSEVRVKELEKLIAPKGTSHLCIYCKKWFPPTKLGDISQQAEDHVRHCGQNPMVQRIAELESVIATYSLSTTPELRPGISFRQWLVGQLAPSMLSKIDWHSSWEKENFTTDVHHLADAIIAHQRREREEGKS